MKTYSYKKWIILLAVSMLTLALLFIAGLPFLANGKIDAYYLRFTIPPQKSLVLGSSRGAQGIIPEIINNKVAGFNKPLYNFAFTGTHSPYGAVYNKAIAKKLDPATTNGLFILEVNPRSISYKTNFNPNETLAKMSESGTILDTLQNFNSQPNIEYLTKYYEDYYYQIILKNIIPQEIELHKDGWLEISCRMDKFNIERRKKVKLKDYKNAFSKNYSFSAVRYGALSDLISNLKTKGSVFIVRLPVSTEMRDLETAFMPDFDERMLNLTDNKSVFYLTYFDLSSKVRTTDGNHLYKESGRQITELIAEDIKRTISKPD